MFYIGKFTCSEITSSNLELKREFYEARINNEIISLADNQLLRFIRQIRDREYSREYVEELYKEREAIKNAPNTKENNDRIKEIKQTLDKYLYVPDLVSVLCNTSKQDYKMICKNRFSLDIDVHGEHYHIRYRRLCAGAGQLRRNTSFFVNEDIYEMLEQIMLCGLTRKSIGKINLAKFGAYFALYTSSMKEVTMPKICVIPDYEYTLKDELVTWIYQKENGEFDTEDRKIDLEVNAFDGHGVVSPHMAQKWAEDLKLDYIPCTFIVRSAWLKGAVSTFDFHKFAKEIAHTDTITDYWGVSYNIDKIDVIMTVSQFKTYKKYENFQQYTHYHKMYHHIFGIARYSKEENDFMTELNYQYIQSNNFTDENVKRLADYSLRYIEGVMTGDPLYTRLFMIGGQEDDLEVDDIESGLNRSISKALMYSNEILNDEFVRNKINRLISKKLDAVKIGKVLVEGSYDFAIPDLYALAQHAFCLEVTGLLKRKQCYNWRWVEKGSTKICIMRSPLVAPAENQLLDVYSDENCLEWYQYIYSGQILNIWDTSCVRSSDSDYDGRRIAVFKPLELRETL